MRSSILAGYFVVSLVFTTCREEEPYDNALPGSWIIVDIGPRLAIGPWPSAGLYVVSMSDNAYEINFEINRCGGKYRIKSKTQLVFERPFCTKVCCDSEHAEQLKGLFEKLLLIASEAIR